MVAWVGGVWVTNFIIKKGKKLNIVYIMNGLDSRLMEIFIVSGNLT